MSVGNVNSPEKGSGARYNDGKVKMEYIPMRVLLACMREDLDDATLSVVDLVTEFEESRDVSYLAQALDIIGFRDVCDVFHYGAQKYAAWNWAKGVAWSIPLACIKRHLMAVATGEQIDPESGLPHFGHVGCNIVMLMHFMWHYPEGNDLPSLVCFSAPGQEPDFADEEPLIEWDEHGWVRHDYQPMTAERAAELREQTNARYA